MEEIEFICVDGIVPIKAEMLGVTSWSYDLLEDVKKSLNAISYRKKL
jgi:hypothetical protein